MADERRYWSKVPDGYAGPRCEHTVAVGFRCGLPAWDGAPEDDPRCAFHSQANPDDIKQRLEEAVTADTDLWGACLPGAWLAFANLSGAHLRGADLSSAQLTGADLSGADLREANLSGAHLLVADLSGADLRDADARCSTFLESHIGVLVTAQREHKIGIRPAGTIRGGDLRGGDFRGAHWKGARIAPETSVEGARFGRCPVCPHEDRIADEPHGNHDACAQVYRQLKLAFQQPGNYERAGNFYFREMQCLRRVARKKGQRLRHAWLWVLEVLTGYGEHPWRVAVAALATVCLFALLQGYFGGVLGEVGSFGPGVEWVPSLAGLQRLGMALYFSFVTFTTLGYGDIHPATGLGRAFASIEAIVGMILMSLFLVCVARKFSR